MRLIRQAVSHGEMCLCSWSGVDGWQFLMPPCVPAFLVSLMRELPLSRISMNARFAPVVSALTIWLCCSAAVGQARPAQITVHGDKGIHPTQTPPPLQVGVNPPLQRGT